MVTSAAAGCGGDECPGDPAAGSYLMSMTQRAGDCAESAEFVVALSESGSSADGCVTTFEQEDACGTDFEIVCADADGTFTMTAGLDYTQGGGAEGVITVSLDDASGAHVCHGTYDTVMSPL